MRLRCHNKSLAQGSVLVTTLVLAIILGSTLAGYLYWVRTQNVLVAQSQAWNTALAHAEAGVEEAMAQLNVSFGTNYHPSALTNWGVNAGLGGYGPRTNAFANGGYSAVIIASPSPTIISTGFAVVPYIGKTVVRTVRVDARCSSAFGNAIAAINGVTMAGNYVMVDSYDSFDPAHSTNGLYDPLTRKANADICSSDGIITIGNADIYGHVRTAPWGSAGTGPSGQVGDLSFTGPGIEAGYWLNDYNAEFADVTDPFDPTLAINNIPGGLGTNTFEVVNGDYYVSGNFSLKANETLHIAGNARIWITGNFTMQSQNGSFLAIDSGATVKMFVGTTTGPAVSSTFTTVNNSGNAFNFQYFGLPSNTSLSWNGNASYVGTVYAPEADFTLGGGGNSSVSDYQGACVVRSVTMNGHFNFHYDENLQRNGPPSRYTISSWREL